ncbi:MAG: triose-phosphate isomerase [Deltaproteobacteria bacterium]|nr:triose-phosphate isomerase [Deltaproteobacteria bacterium]
MKDRRPIMAGNWKMHKGPAEARDLIRELWEELSKEPLQCEVIVAPPFVSVPAAVEAARGTAIQVAGQNLYWEDKGAYTGEVSGPMLKQAGCSHVIIGHSERRQYFGETDETVNRRIEAAIRNDLVPIFCLGETIAERQAGRTFDVIRTQLQGGLGSMRLRDPVAFVIAYEPVWAIGTGHTATPDQAQKAHEFLREELRALLGPDFAAEVRILYGGSVKRDNSRSLMACPDIDGGLVGGASLQAGDFLGIIREGT